MSLSDSNELTRSASADAGRKATADSACPRPNPSNRVRLQKHLAACGLGSRRACELLIGEGRVSVNGQPVTQQGVCVDPHSDTVLVDGRPVAVQRARYWIVYKPCGIVSTCHDPEGRKTVLDLLPRQNERLYPVGRLDYASEGLLLLTNDGALAARLLHPRHEVPKLYRVQTAVALTRTEADHALRGVESEGERLRVASIAAERQGPQGGVYRVELRQGRKRQIRRIFAELGHRVLRLTRVAMGSLTLGTLQPGEWRELTRREIEELYRAAGLEAEKHGVRSAKSAANPKAPMSQPG